MARLRRFTRGRWDRLMRSHVNSRNLPNSHLFQLQRTNYNLLVGTPRCGVRSAQRADPTKAISNRRISNAQLTAPRNTSEQVISSKSSYRNDSSHHSLVKHSISIAAFVLSILRRTCFVSTSAAIFHSLVVRPRCTSGWLTTSWRFGQSQGLAPVV